MKTISLRHIPRSDICSLTVFRPVEGDVAAIKWPETLVCLNLDYTNVSGKFLRALQRFPFRGRRKLAQWIHRVSFPTMPLFYRSVVRTLRQPGRDQVAKNTLPDQLLPNQGVRWV